MIDWGKYPNFIISYFFLRSTSIYPKNKEGRGVWRRFAPPHTPLSRISGQVLSNRKQISWQFYFKAEPVEEKNCMKSPRITLFITLGVLLILVVALTACAGPQGPAGIAGPPGAMGPAGSQGPAGPPGADVSQSAAEYIGAATCAGCHEDIYNAFMKTGHAWELNPVIDGRSPAYPFTRLVTPPEGYTWDDISYVIGGYNWKARFMDLEGYIITDRPEAATSDANYLNQWNFSNPTLGIDGAWVTYHSGEPDLQFTCGACHTTNYSPDGNQDGLPGIVGTWSEPGVKCEECHGPGSLHVSDPGGFSMQVDRDAELCGKCHIRDAIETVDARDGFIEHHEQYEELFQSKHIALDCVICHDPHQGVVQLRQAKEATTRTLCENCHFEQAKYQNNPRHVVLSLSCLECHMPRVIKSAWGDPEKFTGDIRTHMMGIDPTQIGQFSEDGATALSQVGMDFACRRCHLEGLVKPLTDEELVAAASGYHNRP